jgi:hypothetical protein
MVSGLLSGTLRGWMAKHLGTLRQTYTSWLGARKIQWLMIYKIRIGPGGLWRMNTADQIAEFVILWDKL